MLLMWMGELITQRGIGNGISLMIFASIVSRLPHGLQAWWTSPDPVFKVMMPFLAIGVIAAVVFVQEGQRRIPVQYAQARDRPAHDAGRADLPAAAREHGGRDPGHLRGVILMAFPPTVGQLINQPWAQASRTSSTPGTRRYLIGETLLHHHSSPTSTRRSRSTRSSRPTTSRSYGGFIPGVRPGRPTAEFLDRILARLTFPGALFLAAVAALPTLLINPTGANFFFGGTSLLIVVGVALDTMKQLEAQLMMRNYEGFLK